MPNQIKSLELETIRVWVSVCENIECRAVISKMLTLLKEDESERERERERERNAIENVRMMLKIDNHYYLQLTTKNALI